MNSVIFSAALVVILITRVCCGLKKCMEHLEKYLNYSKVEPKHVQSGHLAYKNQKDTNIENICSIQSTRQVSSLDKYDLVLT